MDTRDSNLRALPTPPANALITADDLRAQLDRDHEAIIRAATEDVEADLALLLDMTLEALPRKLGARLVKMRALQRVLMLDGHSGAAAASDDYRNLLNELELNIEHVMPPKRGRKPRPDA